MNRFIEYLKSEYKIISATGIFLVVFLMLFIFTNLDMHIYVLGLEIIFFMLLIYLVVGFFFYKKELNLKEKYEILSDENKSLRKNYIDKKRDLEEYFLMWAHQIKTPIIVINLILNKGNDTNYKKLREEIFYVEEYTNMAMNYLKIIDRNVDMDIDKVDLDQLIKSLIKKYSMIFISKNISISYDAVDKKVVTDGKLLSILIEQILGNALKYTEEGTIYIYFADNILTIKDTGIGIRSEDIKKIFDRGYSGFNGRVTQKSSGLGLYMVKKISEIINVKVNVKSKLGEGSEFSISFPPSLTKL